MLGYSTESFSTPSGLMQNEQDIVRLIFF